MTDKELDMIAEDSADNYVEAMCDKNKSFNVEDTYIEGYKSGYQMGVEQGVKDFCDWVFSRWNDDYPIYEILEMYKKK